MCRCEEGWVPKNWCFQTVVLEKTLESPLDSKESKSVNPKRNQPWIFIGRTDAEAEAPTLWSLNVKSWFIGKDLHARKDWRQRRSRVIWRVRWLDGIMGLNWREFEQTLGDSEGQGSLECSAVHGVAKSWTRLSNQTTARSVSGLHIFLFIPSIVDFTYFFFNL